MTTLDTTGPRSGTEPARPEPSPIGLPPGAGEDSASDARRLRRWARVVLIPVGLIGAALSFANIYDAALPTFGPALAAGVPFLVDFLILGASLMYIAGAKVGRPRAGWRLTAHAGVAGTLLLNAMASPDLVHLPWHVVAPAVWSVLVEMSAREVLGEWRAVHAVPADRIQRALWFSAPIESTRTALHMMRTGTRSAAVARREVGVNAAARRIMGEALPDVSSATRRTLRNRLRDGSLDAETVVRAVGWHPDQPSHTGDAIDGKAAEKAALVAVVTGIIPVAPTRPPVPPTPTTSPEPPSDRQAPVPGPTSEEPEPQSAPEPAPGNTGVEESRMLEDAAQIEDLRRRAADLQEQAEASRAEAARLRQEADDAAAARAAAETSAQQAAAEAEAQRQRAEQIAEAMDRMPFAVMHLAAQMRHDGNNDVELNGSDVALRYGAPPRTGRRWLREARSLLDEGVPAPDIADSRPLRSAATS